MKTKKTLKSVTKKCKSCGGNLVFDPATQKLFCEKCESKTDFVKRNKIQVHKLAGVINTQQNVKTELENFSCESCGATVSLSRFEVSKICPYCESSLVVDHSDTTGLNPDGVIPFAFDKEVAKEKFKQNIKKNWLAPQKFKKAMPSKQIQGIYIPSFGFNVDTISSYSGVLYNEHTHTDSDGHSHTTRSYFNISGVSESKFTDIQVETSSRLTQSELSAILPYNYNYKMEYSDSFVRGFSVERYNTTVKDCLTTYKQILDENVKRNVLRKYSYDGISRLSITTNRSNETYSYLLLPVYRFEYIYKNKPYVTYMNGQTGIMDKNVPTSKVKITFLVLIFVLIFALPIILSLING